MTVVNRIIEVWVIVSAKESKLSCPRRNVNKEHDMSTMKIAIVAVVLTGVVGPLACKENNRDEQQLSASKAAGATQSTAQKPNEKPDSDEGEEGEEGPAVPGRVAPEKPASQKSPGK